MQNQGLHLYSAEKVHIHDANVYETLTTESINSTGLINVTGDIIVSNDLKVVNNVEIDNNLEVKNNLEVLNDLEVIGDTVLGKLEVVGGLYLNGGPIFYDEGISETISYSGPWSDNISYNFDVIGNMVFGTIFDFTKLCGVNGYLQSTSNLSDSRLLPDQDIETQIIVSVNGLPLGGRLSINTTGGTQICIYDAPNNDLFQAGTTAGVRTCCFNYRTKQTP